MLEGTSMKGNEAINKGNNRNIFKVLRQCMGLNLNEMAHKCQVSSIYYNQLETGRKTKPSERILQSIADACDIQIDTLKFFLEEHHGKSLDYEKYLLKALETLAKANQIGEYSLDKIDTMSRSEDKVDKYITENEIEGVQTEDILLYPQEYKMQG